MVVSNGNLLFQGSIYRGELLVSGRVNRKTYIHNLFSGIPPQKNSQKWLKVTDTKGLSKLPRATGIHFKQARKGWWFYCCSNLVTSISPTSWGTTYPGIMVHDPFGGGNFEAIPQIYNNFEGFCLRCLGTLVIHHDPYLPTKPWLHRFKVGSPIKLVNFKEIYHPSMPCFGTKQDVELNSVQFHCQTDLRTSWKAPTFSFFGFYGWKDVKRCQLKQLPPKKPG